MPLCEGGGGSVKTQHQTIDRKQTVNATLNNGSSGRPGALLQLSYFTMNLHFGTGEDDKKPGSIPCDTIISYYFVVSRAVAFSEPSISQHFS